MDWQSTSQAEQHLFDKLKISTNNGRVGLELEQFQMFLKQSLYPYLIQVIASQCKRTNNNNSRIKFSPSQELQLFKRFDVNDDHLLDQTEFAELCNKWLHKIYRKKSALVIVDVQNDFIDGSLALINSPAEQDGAEVVPVINKLLEANLFDTVVYTQDWHPIDHIGFHDNLHLRKYTCKSDPIKRQENGQKDDTNKDTATSASANNSSDPSELDKLSTKVKVFDTVLFDEGRMEQIVWPRHCVQGSWGAELHPKLKIVRNSVRILKGTLSDVDAYSAFWDNMRLNETNLREELISRGVTDVFFCGLAYDYCVSASAIDSKKANFMTYVIEDACRGINTSSIYKKTKEMIDNDILIVSAESTFHYLVAARNIDQVYYEESRLQGDNNKCNSSKAKFDCDWIEHAESYDMRSDDIGDILVASCFKKAFLH